MADEFNSTGSWWDSARHTAAGASSSSSALGSFGSWASEMDADVKPRTSNIDSVSVSGSSVHDSSTDLHMMGLGLSSQPMDWNQTLLSRSTNNKGGAESGFRSMLQDSMSSSSSYATQESAWRAGENAASVRGFSLDQSAESPVTASSFQMDSAVLYGNPSTLLQGILQGSSAADNQPPPNRGLSFHQFGGGSENYGSVNPSEMMQLQQPASSWNSNSSSKAPQFLRGSPPKQMLFSNNAPFWNPAATVADVRPSFFSSPLQPQFPTSAPSFDEKPKNISEAGDSISSVAKKSGSDAASKRPRNETTSTLPAFKVRKEKMGDRITALQQLVSPFGKTDTASVLSEAIEYIKFLHDQVHVLSTPYMKSGSSVQHQQQNLDKSNEPEGPKQDLRSRGLCLVPVSSTFPVTHETTVDFWTPTFGGTFR